MHIEDFQHITETYDHIYLSPHLDDAALSCGGAIAKQRAEGQRVLVVAICTAIPPPEGPFNSIAEELHRIWGLDPSEVVTARMREDRVAMEHIGADSYYVGLLDAIYRYPDAYTSRETLFGMPAADDPMLPELREFIHTLRARVPKAKLYAPLAIGDHVDHQITFAATLDGVAGEVLFYEDFPYVAKAGALEKRMQALEGTFSPFTIDIEKTLAQKISAIAAYASQLDELFGGAEAMAQLVASHTRGILPGASTPVERFWERSA